MFWVKILAFTTFWAYSNNKIPGFQGFPVRVETLKDCKFVQVSQILVTIPWYVPPPPKKCLVNIFSKYFFGKKIFQIFVI